MNFLVCQYHPNKEVLCVYIDIDIDISVSILVCVCIGGKKNDLENVVRKKENHQPQLL